MNIRLGRWIKFVFSFLRVIFIFIYLREPFKTTLWIHPYSTTKIKKKQ